MPTSYKVHMGVSLSLSGLAAIAVALTLLPGTPVVPEAAAFTLFGLMFPVLGSAVLRCRRAGVRTQGQEFLDLLWHTPRWLKLAAGGLALGVVLCLALGADPAGGQPERTAEGYYLDDRGVREPVSRDTYESAVKAVVREFDAGAACVFALSAVLVAAAFRAEEEALARWREARHDA
ncbi:hypothetical protein [Streptomyces sp. C10-9-1]|uniref:hypothetical protein n=1 Tax=Streptomyces sp. C10-9-1 TaxID=1859285 RepID=UPI003D73C873